MGQRVDYVAVCAWVWLGWGVVLLSDALHAKRNAAVRLRCGTFGWLLLCYRV
ncbi:hypothetical protein VC0395_1033 [Vibrio cholerae O395]|uniref:Uncharacterized protein n=2 Tax=Vibrio cholerae TaxID=666 RepID=A0A655S9Q1_VIBCL|nr:hypothetical protein VC0395_1033 [Vibrio cholerae O395]EMP99214.1 hypothetical protein VC95412_001929 [Vibrio cholerae O1 str. 95412]CSB18962.1 Uncharacterised protein [Vibrio cholerae]CSB28270.1 Uncharacterised protein [Vibrio cholerae]